MVLNFNIIIIIKRILERILYILIEVKHLIQQINLWKLETKIYSYLRYFLPFRFDL